MERSILHINICHFYTAIACIQSPRLRGYPLAVRAPGSRRTLLDISSEAWKAGVCRGMTFDAAKRLCPDLVLLDPTPSVYERIDKTLFDRACTLSPLVERAGPGHLFVDLTGTRRLFGSAADVATRLRASIGKACSIDPAIGIAASRLVSKIATRVIKPHGFFAVLPGGEEKFMAPLPLVYLPGLETRLFERLRQFNLRRIGEITRIPATTLATAIGPAAFSIHQFARGIDPTPVLKAEALTPSVEECVVLGEPTNDDTLLARALFRLIGLVCSKIRARGLAAGAIQITIRYADGMSAAKSMAIHPPVNGDLSLYEKCLQLLHKLFLRRVRLTEIAVQCRELVFPYGQLDLFARTVREDYLMTALDTIRATHGKTAIRFWGRESTV